MPNQTLTDSQADAKAWFAASQWSAFKGEMRVNQLRLAAIVVFYLTHLFHYMGLDQFLGLPAVNSIIPENQAVPFHQAVTAMAVAWLCVVAAVRTCLSVPYFPAALPYISTTMDTLLLSILLYATRGPASAMVGVYFLIIAMAGLRFKVRLVWCAVAASALGYRGLFMTPWIGPPILKFQSYPYYQRSLLVLCLVVMGLVQSGIIMQVRAMANDYKKFLAELASSGPHPESAD